MYKVLITSSGTGSRLENLTKDTNKSLVLLKNKPIIDYIIESYPKNVELVFTLGYFGDKVKEYLLKKYSDRKLTFVWVDKYQGEGSSLGYSLLKAKDELQCPFVFHCNDTLVFDQPIPSPEEYNWNAGSKGLDNNIFKIEFLSSFTVENGFMKVMNRKGASEWDLFHIGLVGYKDYFEFWQALEKLYKENPNDSSLNDCAAMQIMVNKGIQFRAIEFKKWLDTGNLTTLSFAERNL
jgi:choline kinase